MRLLVTRPEPDGARTAQALRARGHAALLCPLLRIETVPSPPLGDGPWDAVVITSANAAQAVAQHPERERLTALPVLATGRRSAEAARTAGFTDVRAAGGDFASVVRLARAQFPGRRVLYLAGADPSGDLAAALAPAGITVQMIVVYRAVQAEALPQEAAAAIAAGEVDGVLHYSRRTAEAYVRCACAAGLI